MSISSNIFDKNSCKLEKEVPCNYNDTIDESILNNDEEEFPAGVRVLLVDADSNSLLLMTNLLAQYSYQVTIYENGEEAMAFLMKSKHEIDLVIWDFYMPDINGLDALNTIGKEMDLPVVIMSYEHKKETVMKSIKYGACDFLVKPVSKEVIAVLWRHVFRKRMSTSGLDKLGESATLESDPDGHDDLELDNLCQSNEEGSKNTSDQKGNTSSSKKPRITWTAELRHKFEVAVHREGGLEKAFPKQILKYMQEELNVQGLTRNNVSSHLQQLRWQKFRLNKRTRTPEETQEDFGYRNVRPHAAPLTAASNPVLSSSVNFHSRAPYMMMSNQAEPRASYYVNDQAVGVSAPIQYSSNSYLPMNNNSFMTNHLNYIDQFQQPQLQQCHHSLNIPSMLTKQEPGHVPLTNTGSLAEESWFSNPSETRVSSAMENSDQLIYNSTFPFDHNEYFPLPEFSNFD